MMRVFIGVFVLVWAATAQAGVTIGSWHLPALHHEDDVPLVASSPRRSAEDFSMLNAFAASLELDIVALQGVATQDAAHRLFPKTDYWIHGAPKLDPATGELKGVRGRTYAAFALRKRSAFEVIAVDTLPAFAIEHIEVGSGDETIERALPSAASVTIDSEGETITLLSVHFQPGCPNERLILQDKNDRRRAKDSNRYACRTLLAQALLLENWIEQQHAFGRSVIVLGEFNRHLNSLSGRGRVPDDFWVVLSDGQPESLVLRKGPSELSVNCSQNNNGSDSIPTQFMVFDASLDPLVDPASILPIPFPENLRRNGLAQCPMVLELFRRPP